MGAFRYGEKFDYVIKVWPPLSIPKAKTPMHLASIQRGELFNHLPLNSSPLCIIWPWNSSELLASPARTDGGPDKEHSGLMFNTVGADSGRKLPGRPRENLSLDSSSSSP